MRFAYLLCLCIFLVGCAAPVAPLTATVPPPSAEEIGQTPVASAPALTQAVALPLVEINPTATFTPLPTFTPTTTPPVRFAVIGDYGGGGRPEADVARLVGSWAPDFIITLGDNNYPDGAASTIDQNIGRFYHPYIFPYRGSYGDGADQNRFFPTLGNHDWNTALAQPYLDYFTLPGNERYYDFTWGNVHFFALDSDSREPDGVNQSSVQAKWLRNQLASASETWKIVYFHHAPYSSGLHGSITWARWPYKEWGASAVLAGHDHTYERLLVDGLPYFVNGLGGGAIYRFVDILPESQVRYVGDYGAMLVEAYTDRMVFQFVTRQGEVIDTYTLSK